MAINDVTYTFISAFVALFPVLNPIGNGFIVNEFLVGLDAAQREKIIRKIACNCLLIGVCSLVLGKLVLLIFNLAIPVVQLGGGILISKMGFDWLSGKAATPSAEGKAAIEALTLNDIELRLFYPISFPICFGPGSISVIFTLIAMVPAQEHAAVVLIDYLAIAFAIVVLCGILYLCFTQSGRLMNHLGRSATLIINKLVAFLTFCVGIQIVVTGISKIFHLSIL